MRSGVQQSFGVRHPFLAPRFFSENVFRASYGPSSVLVCSVSALSLMGATGMGVLWSPLEGGALLGAGCSQESSLEADAPQEAREPLALGCIGSFPKWMNILLLLLNLFLRTKMGNGLSEQTSSSDNKKYPPVDSLTVPALGSQCLDKKPLEGAGALLWTLIDFCVHSALLILCRKAICRAK